MVDKNLAVALWALALCLSACAGQKTALSDEPDPFSAHSVFTTSDNWVETAYGHLALDLQQFRKPNGPPTYRFRVNWFAEQDTDARILIPAGAHLYVTADGTTYVFTAARPGEYGGPSVGVVAPRWSDTAYYGDVSESQIRFIAQASQVEIKVDGLARNVIGRFSPASRTLFVTFVADHIGPLAGMPGPPRKCGLEETEKWRAASAREKKQMLDECHNRPAKTAAPAPP